MQNIDYDLRSVQEVRDLARLGQIATEKIANYTEDQIDRIIRNMVRVAEENAVSLAQMAVEETGFGKVADKTYKNHMASTLLYDAIKDMKTIGIVSEDPIARTMDVADPVGLLMGIVPSTNPTSTAIFKSIIAIKARNGIVFSPHPSAAKCTLKAATLMRDAAVEAGAPENIIGCISMPSMPATDELMHSKEVKMIIATGGPGMVKASYSAGKPALGVGAGNSPAYIERTANVQQAVTNIIASKTFDNGVVSAAEQSVVVDSCIAAEVRLEFEASGAYFMTEEEAERLGKLFYFKDGSANPELAGKAAEDLARWAKIDVPAGTKVLLAEQKYVSENNPYSKEKLCPVLSYFIEDDWMHACEKCIELLLSERHGHTLVIHSKDPDVIHQFAIKKPVGRMLVNTPAVYGSMGATTNLFPAMTLGSGSAGQGITSDNVSPMNLIYVRKVGYGVRRIEDLGMGTPADASGCRGAAADEDSLRKLQRLLEDALASINNQL